MVTTSIQKIVNILEKALLDLNASSSQEFIESTAILIHEAMSGRHRRFHTTDHIFQVVDPERDPILVLAALFHDVVYYNVDGGFTARIERLISPYVTIELDQVFIRRKAPTGDRILPILNQIFGFSCGQLLTPFTGLNEFLSAVVFTRLFMEFLPTQALLGVNLCIEASIPFRGPNEEGKTPFEVLEERLLKLNRVRSFGIGESETVDLVHKALKFANLDVSNFTCDRPQDFLDHTWKLFPENNPHLLLNTVYTLSNYRRALEKMDKVFAKVDVTRVFHQYRQEPSNGEFKKMQLQAQKNATLGKQYVAGRTLAIGILEALCLATGGDVPVAMILGNHVTLFNGTQNEFMDLLEKIPQKTARDVNSKVLELLHYEDDVLSFLHRRQATLAAYVYQALGDEKTATHLALAKAFFAGEIEAESFLSKVESSLVSALARVCAEMISTRRHRFLAWSKPLEPKRTAV